MINDSAIRKRSPVATLKGRTAHMLDLTSNRDVPGPGKYDARDPTHVAHTFAFGHAPLKGDNARNSRYQSPGPGSYNIRKNFGEGSKSVTILGRYETSTKSRVKLLDSPGPGAYNIDKNYNSISGGVFNRTSPAFSLKGAVSEDPIMREKKMMPPPGLYNPKDDFVRKKPAGISFGPRPPKPPRTAQKTGEPGPGDYKIPSTLDTTKGTKIAALYNDKPKDRHNSPGPGTYFKSLSEIGPSSKRGIILLSRPKDKKEKYPTPGPGAYDQKSQTFVSSSKGIILLGRHKESTGESGPGPGAYDVKAKYFDSENKKISFGHGDRFGRSKDKDGKFLESIQ